MKGIILLNAAGAVEKSVDGKGAIERGTFYVNGAAYENATCVGGMVYDQDGNLVGPVDA
ncbi:MAG: hypothetical protein IJU75_06355 [Clostridia bacterium]|nr:hypothetical protein [Clostridia bacterium]